MELDYSVFASVGWGSSDQLDVFRSDARNQIHDCTTWDLDDVLNNKADELASGFSSIIQSDKDDNLLSIVEQHGEKCLEVFQMIEGDDVSNKGLERAIIMLIHVVYGQSHRETGGLAGGLAEWYNLHYDLIEDTMNPDVDDSYGWSAANIHKIFDGCQSYGEKYELYWECCLRCAALGFYTPLAEALRYHSSYQEANPSPSQETETEILANITAVIKVRPCLQPLMPLSIEDEEMIEDRSCNSWIEYQEALDAWCDQIEVIQKSSVFLEHKHTNKLFIENLDNVLFALKGKKSVLQRSTNGWIEYLIALLLNENANITPAALPYLVQSCINTVGLQRSSEGESDLETLLVATLNLDTETVLRYLVNHDTTISPLCRVHSAVLMWKEPSTRSLWHQVAPEIGCSLMEHYCIQLVFRIQYQQSAFEYLMGCPRSKIYAIISRLDAIWDAGEDGHLDYAMHWCEKLRIPDYGKRLMYDHGVRLMQKERHGESLPFLIQSGDQQLPHIILQKMLKQLHIELKRTDCEEQVWLPSLPYQDWMSPVWATAQEHNFLSSILSFFKTYSVLKNCLGKLFTTNGTCHNHKNNLITDTNFEELRTSFLNILEAESLPNFFRLYFISRACRVQELHPEVFHPEDRTVLGAHLDYASVEDPIASRRLRKYRVQLCGLRG